MSVSDQELILNSFTRCVTRTCATVICTIVNLPWREFFFNDFLEPYFTLDRDYKGASEDDDDEAPRISLQEMLEDLHLEEPDSSFSVTEMAAMMTE